MLKPQYHTAAYITIVCLLVRSNAMPFFSARMGHTQDPALRQDDTVSSTEDPRPEMTRGPAFKLKVSAFRVLKQAICYSGIGV